MTTKVVIDIGYGDSGKGLVTDYLALTHGHMTGDPGLIVRFNGGSQAGHNVYQNEDKSHVFSHFGSGTFQGFTTFWSKYCPVNPTSMLEENLKLYHMHGIETKIIVDPLCPVTTPYDIAYNQALESYSTRRHGSVGVGFGATIERHHHTPHKLFIQDLKYPMILDHKLKEIRNYYLGKAINEAIHYPHPGDSEIDVFKKDASSMTEFADMKSENKVFEQYRHNTIIFEGAQGIMLDMDHGFFPHVTRSHTTCRNAMEMINRNKLNPPDIYYVTRAYQTRHGAGPMTNEDHWQNGMIKDNPHEKNKLDPWQGHFRKAILDIDQLKYAVECDSNYFEGYNKNLVITCLDHLDNNGLIPWTTQGTTDDDNTPEELRDLLLYPTAGLFTSNSPYGHKIVNHSKKMVNSL